MDLPGKYRYNENHAYIEMGVTVEPSIKMVFRAYLGGNALGFAGGSTGDKDRVRQRMRR